MGSAGMMGFVVMARPGSAAGWLLATTCVASVAGQLQKDASRRLLFQQRQCARRTGEQRGTAARDTHHQNADQCSRLRWGECEGAAHQLRSGFPLNQKVFPPAGQALALRKSPRQSPQPAQRGLRQCQDPQRWCLLWHRCALSAKSPAPLRLRPRQAIRAVVGASLTHMMCTHSLTCSRQEERIGSRR